MKAWFHGVDDWNNYLLDGNRPWLQSVQPRSVLMFSTAFTSFIG